MILPPAAFVAAPVQLAMVQPADRHGEPVADLASHRALLCELDVVRIGRNPATDQTWLGGHKFQMVAIALAHRFSDGSDSLGIDLGRR